MSIIKNKLSKFMFHTLLMSTQKPIEIECFPYQHVGLYLEKNEISILTYNIKQLLHWTDSHNILNIISYLMRKTQQSFAYKKYFRMLQKK